MGNKLLGDVIQLNFCIRINFNVFANCNEENREIVCGSCVYGLLIALGTAFVGIINFSNIGLLGKDLTISQDFRKKISKAAKITKAQFSFIVMRLRDNTLYFLK